MGADVRTATRTFFEGLQTGRARSAHLLTILFWTGLVTWARLLYLQLTVDEERRRRRIEALDRTVEDLKGTIFRAPNATVYERAKEYFEETAELLDTIEKEAQSLPAAPELRRIVCQSEVAAVLQAIVRLAQAFNLRVDDGGRYRANVMLVEKCRPKETPPFPPVLPGRLHFFDSNHFAETTLLGLLYIPSALAYPPPVKPPGHSIHELVLPLPREAMSGEVRRALPGAPWAFLTGEMSVHEDTRRIASEWPDLDPKARREIDAHFSRGGGAHLRSFVSFRIGNNSGPVGVLNLDSPETHLLGSERLYYSTFHALVAPFLRLLEQPVKEYEQMARADLLTAA
jgi:hypothetical protein